MTDDLMARWPRFELVTFEAPTGIPNGWDAELIEKGAPKRMMGRYRAAKKLTLLEGTDQGPLVIFGKEMRYESVCLDPRTGHVVDITYIDVATPNLPAGVIGQPTLVNSTLDQFIASVRAVIGRFPFDDGSLVWKHDSTEAEDEANTRLTDQTVADLRDLLTEIDAAALEIDGFWATFFDDVQMGNFSTAGVLSDEPATFVVTHADGTKEEVAYDRRWEADFW